MIGRAIATFLLLFVVSSAFFYAAYRSQRKERKFVLKLVLWGIFNATIATALLFIFVQLF